MTLTLSLSYRDLNNYVQDRVGYLIEKEKSYIIDIEKRIGKYNELLG